MRKGSPVDRETSAGGVLADMRVRAAMLDLADVNGDGRRDIVTIVVANKKGAYVFLQNP